MALRRRIIALASALSLLLGSPAAAAIAAAAAPAPCLELSETDAEAYQKCLVHYSTPTVGGLAPSPIPALPVARLQLAAIPAVNDPDALRLPQSAAALFDGSRTGAKGEPAGSGSAVRASESRQSRSAQRGPAAAAPRPLQLVPSHVPLAAAPSRAWTGEAAEAVKVAADYWRGIYERTREYLSDRLAKARRRAALQTVRPAAAAPVPQRPIPDAPKQKPTPQPRPQPQPQAAADTAPAPEVETPAPSEPEASQAQAAPSEPPAPPEPPKPPVDLGPLPKYDPGNFGTGVYDVLSWGFWGGDSKAVLDLARKEVNEAAVEFTKSVTPALTSSLRKFFLQLEQNTETGAAAKIRLDFGADWFLVGATTARFLHAVDGAQKAIEGVLARYSGMFYEAAGVELEAKLLETALKAGALSAPAAEQLGARLKALVAQREKIQALMRGAIGRDKDFTMIVSAEDEAYLTALAQDAGDGFMTDARTKLWLTTRVDAVMSLIEAQVKKKAALEALKMALMAEKNQGDEKKSVIEDFLKFTREGLSVSQAIESATDSPELRQAVLESQKEFAAGAEAGSQLKLAKALKQLAILDVVPNLRLGIEEGWQEGQQGIARPQFGFHVRWAVTSALRLLWSGEDLKAPQLEVEIAKMNVLQAARDKTYNFDRAGAAVSRYTDKVAFDGGYPTAEDIALYGRARQVFSYSPDVALPAELASLELPASGKTAVGTLKDLLKVTVENSPLARIAQLRLQQSEENLKKSSQRVNVEVGVSGGEMVIDSLLPSLTVTLENLGRQKEAAQVKRLGSSLRHAKTVFELMYAVLHYANDYLYALQSLDAAKEAVAAAAAAGDKKALSAAQGASIEADYRVRQVEAELRRLLGKGVALPTKDALAEIFSRGNDQLYWGNPLFKQFNMDATMNEAAARVMEDLVETQKALAGVPELRIHLSSIFAMILAPSMPWMSVLMIMDAARTGLPLLSALFSKVFPGKREKEREAKLTEFYRRLQANKDSADALSAEYMRQREELKAMGAGVSDAPKNAEESHQFNRWRIAALAYEVAPGAEYFLSDRVVAMVEKGQLKEAAELWKLSHAREKLEAGGKPSATGELLRRKLNENAEFKAELAKKILNASDWFEAKLLFDPWLKDFSLDFGPELGGKIVKKIVKKGYVAFFEGGRGGGDASVVAQLKEAVGKKDLAKAYELYKKQVGFEARKQSASGDSTVPEAPALTAGNLTDAAAQRALTRRVIALMRAGQLAQGQALLAAAAETYRGSGLDFDKHYPGLKSWTVGMASRDAEPASGKPGFELGLPSWLHDGIGSLKAVKYRLEPVRRVFRLNPEWDLLGGWSSVSSSESSTDRERGLSENLSIMREDYQGTELERRQYSFSGPMGGLGDLRANGGGTFFLTRESPWNPFSPLKSTSETGGESSYALSLTQRGLLPGFDLSEKAVYRFLGNGTRRAEYSLGGSGMWKGSYNFGDVALLGDHYRTYGRFGYGREDDRFSSALSWQADDLYGYEKDKTSGELNLSGRAHGPFFKGLETDLFWSGTAYKNRGYLTSGRYFTDTYTKDVSGFVTLDELGVPRTEGTAAYAGLRQMLVDGKYGGIGMGYAVQSQTGEKNHQYGTASYVAPGGRGQLDVITSDDPSVGPVAVQTQLQAGPALVRLGVDASSYTAVVGVRDPGGNLTLSGRLAQSVEDSSSRAWGAAISTLDSNYAALWSNSGRDVSVSVYQGDVWAGNGLQLDYRKSARTPGETYRAKVALSAFTEASDWTHFVPFAPLVKGIYRSLDNAFSSGRKDEKTKEQVADELGSATSRGDLARKAADLVESAGRRASSQEGADRNAALFLNDVATDMSDGYNDFRRQANTPTPYSWKPAFGEFLTSLSDMVPELRQAQESVLYDRSERLQNSWFAWTPKVVDRLDDVLHKYETYRAAYREQIMAIPVSGSLDRRPQHIVDFNRKSQWFVDYVVFLKTEFLELDRVGKLSDAQLRDQLAALYRLRDESPSEKAPVPAKKALTFLGPSSWLPTSGDIPVRVLESRIGRLIAERQRRAEMDARIEKLKSRAGKSGQEGPKPK